jgi:hypothetical protein
MPVNERAGQPAGSPRLAQLAKCFPFWDLTGHFQNRKHSPIVGTETPIRSWSNCGGKSGKAGNAGFRNNWMTANAQYVC